MDAVCARDAGCAAAAPGSATARLGDLLAKLRTGSITGRTRDADASSVRARVGLREVVDMVQDAGSDPVIYRELDASVRAALAGDNAPLLRLVRPVADLEPRDQRSGLLLQRPLLGRRLHGLPAALTMQSSFERPPPQLATSIASGPPGPASTPSRRASGC